MKRAALVLALLGATAGPLLDGLHTWSGATWYPGAQWLKSVWWCPPLFSFAAVAIGLGRLVTERLLRVPLTPPGARVVTASMTLFVVAYAFSGFSTQGETVKAAVLLISFVVAWWRLDATRASLLGAAGAGFGGWLVEHTLVGAGCSSTATRGSTGSRCGFHRSISSRRWPSARWRSSSRLRSSSGARATRRRRPTRSRRRWSRSA